MVSAPHSFIPPLQRKLQFRSFPLLPSSPLKTRDHRHQIFLETLASSPEVLAVCVSESVVPSKRRDQDQFRVAKVLRQEATLTRPEGNPPQQRSPPSEQRLSQCGQASSVTSRGTQSFSEKDTIHTDGCFLSHTSRQHATFMAHVAAAASRHSRLLGE